MPVRVVLDTNILVSACWKAGSLEERLLDMAIRGEIAACATDEVLAEYRDVLRRPKFSSIRETAEVKLAALEAACLHVSPGERLQLATDDDDNRFLECALAAGARFLVTGNLRHFPETFGFTRIVNAREFLAQGKPVR